MEFWSDTIFAIEFSNFVERVDAQVKNISVAINELYGFLGAPINLDLLQATKGSNPMIDMGDIISLLELGQFF